MSPRVLIGHSGFVGSTLQRQAAFDALYRSTNVGEIDGTSAHTAVCAGAPAQKWLANADPDRDRRNIDELIGHLAQVRCAFFILISTIDVFQNPVGVDEDTMPQEQGLHPYGLNRLRLERFVQSTFSQHLIVRLPGLVGPGLRKNVIYDFLNDNNLHAIDSRNVFQFYPTANLWYDVQTAIQHKLRLVHLTAEPISVAEVALHGFGRRFEQAVVTTPVVYDMRSRYARSFGAPGDYQYSRRESVQAIRAYAQSEQFAKAPK